MKADFGKNRGMVRGDRRGNGESLRRAAPSGILVGMTEVALILSKTFNGEASPAEPHSLVDVEMRQRSAAKLDRESPGPTRKLVMGDTA